MPKLNPNPPFLSQQRAAKFWSYVDQSLGQGPKGDCWEWTRSRNNKGYGRFGIGGYRICLATRIAFFLTRAHWPALNVLHHCDNPPCCRPDHLFDGTQQTNMTDAKDKGRTCVGERVGNSKLTDTTVREIRLLRATGKWRYWQLAERYGVCESLVCQVVKRQVWKHV